MTKQELVDLAREVAFEHRLDQDLVLAMCEVESSFDPYASRFEPQFKWFHKTKEYAKAVKQSEMTEATLQAMSHGMLQIMGATARWLGFSEPIAKLYLPEVGLHWGCVYLKYLLDKYKNVNDAISSYNQGSPKKDNGLYVNNSYVLKVQTAYKNKSWTKWAKEGQS